MDEAVDHLVNVKIDGVIFTPLKIIETPLGLVLHGIKKSDPAYAGFGEAYFSSVLPRAVKGWKRHTRMKMNLIVVSGGVRFVLYDGRKDARTFGNRLEYWISRSNYGRLTVPPGIWMAFQGIGPSENLLMNFASIPHDPGESETLPLEHTSFPSPDWTQMDPIEMVSV